MSLTKADFDQFQEMISTAVRQEVRNELRKVHDRIMTEGRVRAVIREEIAPLKLELASLSNEVGTLTTKVDKLDKKVDKFDGRIRTCENDIEDLYLMVPAQDDMA